MKKGSTFRNVSKYLSNVLVDVQARVVFDLSARGRVLRVMKWSNGQRAGKRLRVAECGTDAPRRHHLNTIPRKKTIKITNEHRESLPTRGESYKSIEFHALSTI